ncbi:protein of unknown function [Ruminococcaceae bacterium BL-4]|nr:protein of unknown function [Ruminococcaceae bacterium BL-4]
MMSGLLTTVLSISPSLSLSISHSHYLLVYYRMLFRSRNLTK